MHEPKHAKIPDFMQRLNFSYFSFKILHRLKFSTETFLIFIKFMNNFEVGWPKFRNALDNSSNPY